MIARASSIVVLALAGVSPASAQFIVNHEPYPFGGPGSDTVVPTSQYPFLWQQSADDFRLSEPATVTHVNWWGFHFENVAPPDETMRIRLYTVRLSDGLPGDLLFEESFANPDRIDTGREIVIGGGPREYRYQAALGAPIDLDPGVEYWIEIVQVGDPNSGFRWELSRAETNGRAYWNNLVPDWTRGTATSDLAFQLVIPEPITASMLLVGLAFASRLRTRR